MIALPSHRRLVPSTLLPEHLSGDFLLALHADRGSSTPSHSSIHRALIQLLITNASIHIAQPCMTSHRLLCLSLVQTQTTKVINLPKTT
jgi:hypothetical protein